MLSLSRKYAIYRKVPTFNLISNKYESKLLINTSLQHYPCFHTTINICRSFSAASTLSKRSKPTLTIPVSPPPLSAINQSSNPSVSEIAKKCTERNKKPLVKFTRAVVKSTIDISSPELTKLLHALYDHNLVFSAVQLYNAKRDAGKINDRHVKSYMKVLRKIGKADLTMSTFQDIVKSDIFEKRTIVNVLYILTEMMWILIECKSSHHVDEIVAYMKAKNIAGDAFTSSAIIASYRDRGMHQEALSYYMSLCSSTSSNHQPTLENLECVLQSMYKTGDVMTSLRLIAEAESVGITPDAKVFTILLRTCIINQQDELAMKIFKAMTQQKPVVVCSNLYNKNVKKSTSASLRYGDMHVNHATKVTAILPDVESYSIMLEIAKMNTQCSLAVHIITQMLKRPDMNEFINMRRLGIAIDLLIIYHRFQEAIELIEDVKTKECRISLIHTRELISKTYIALSTYRKQQRHDAEDRKIVEDEPSEMNETEPIPVSSSPLTIEQAHPIPAPVAQQHHPDSQDTSMSESHIESIDEVAIEDDANIKIEVVLKLCKTRSDFYNLIDFLIDANVKVSPSSFTQVMNSLGQVGYIDEVIRLMVVMRSRGMALKVYHYKALMEILYQANLWELCYRFYRGLNLSILKRDAGFHSIVLKALCEANQHELYETVLEQYILFSERDKSRIGYTVATLCSSFIRLQRSDKALELYERFYNIKHRKADLFLYATLRALTCCLMEQNLPLALKYTIEAIIAGVKIDYTYVDTLIKLASDMKRLDIVWRLFDCMESNAHPIEFYHILQSLTGNEPHIHELESYYPEIEKKLSSHPRMMLNQKRASYSIIIGCLSRCDANQEAIDLFESVRHKPEVMMKPCLRTCINVIGACYLSDQYEKALSYYHMTTTLDFGDSNSIGNHTYCSSASYIDVLQPVKLWSNILFFWFTKSQYDASSDFASESTISDPTSSSSISPSLMSSNNPNNSFIITSNPSTPLRGYHTVDLHNFPEYVSIIALYDIFQQLYQHRQDLDLSSYRGLAIIPGRGNHVNFDGRRGVLRQAIENFLVSGLEPIGVLQYQVSPGNGRIVVPGESIQRWIEAKALNESSMI